MTESTKSNCNTSNKNDSSIYEAWQLTNLNHPELPAIEYFGNQWTFKQCEDLIDIYAHAFSSLLPDKTKSVTFCTPTLPSTFFAFYALNKIGIRANFISHTVLPSNPIEYIEETDTEVLVLFDGFFKSVAKSLRKVKLKKIIIVSLSDGVKTIPEYTSERLRPYLQKSNSAKKINLVMPFKKIMSLDRFTSIGLKSTVAIKEAYNTSDVAVVLYTGGSTGVPKGIEITNETTNNLIEAYKNITNIDPGTRCLVLIPPNHPTSFMISMLMPWRYGATQVLQPIYNKDSFANDLINTKSQFTMAAPSHYATLLNTNLQKGDFSFLRTAFCGGEPVPFDLAIALNDVFERAGVQKPELALGYGMSEIGPMAIFTPNAKGLVNKVGQPLPGVKCRIVDERNNILEDKHRGLLEINTPMRMKGYFKQPELTKAFFTEDGYAITGDIAVRDENGYYDVLGRASDSIVTPDGTKVYLFDIERVVYKDVAVLEAEVVGLNVKGTEIPVVHIVLHTEYIGKDKEIILRIHKLCKEHLSENEIPQGYKIREAFGTNPISTKRDYQALALERDGYYMVDGDEVVEVSF